MFSEFKDFYGLSENQYRELWEECIFVFDTNVLLNLYRYSDSTRDELLKIIEKFNDRIWLPHQVGLEFHFNRATVIQTQIDSYERITNLIKKKSSAIINELNEELKDYKKRHPKIDIAKTLGSIETSFTDLISDIKTLGEDHPDYLGDNDDIQKKLSTIFKHKVGERYDQKKLDEIFKSGEKRYKFEIPPGYKDLSEKKGKKRFFDGLEYSSEYGDLVVWNQIMDKAIDLKKPIIFVTDDVKEDWWEIVKKRRTLGPRIELVNEFRQKTHQIFYMYKTDRFMKYAKNTLHEDISTDAIQEVKDYREATGKNKTNQKESLFLKEFYSEEMPYLTQRDWERLENEFFTNDVSVDQINKLIKDLNTQRRIESSIEEIEDEFKLGDLVFHEKWGYGEIITTINSGHNQEVEIAFEDKKRKVIARYAELTKIDF